MQVTASNFKAYDIRGIVDDALDDAFAEHLGRAFGSEAVRLGREGGFPAVGRDGRVRPGSRLAAALIRGWPPPASTWSTSAPSPFPRCSITWLPRARCHGCHLRHPGHRQLQPEELQRLQDGAGRARDRRRRTSRKLRRPMETRDLRHLRIGRAVTMDILAEYTHPHHERLQARAPDEDRRRPGQRHPRRLRPRHPARARLRGDRSLQPRRRRLSQPPSGPVKARESGRPDPHGASPPRPSWAWPSTATATASASSRAAATRSFKISTAS